MNFPELKKLPAIWLSMIFLIILLGLLKIAEPEFELVSWITVFIHATFALFVLSTIPMRLRTILIWAFLVRLMFMIWDIYARSIFVLPNSGADALMYYGSSLKISEDITLLNLQVRGGIYAKMIGTLFYIIGPQRMVAQYINVLTGLFVIIVIYKILIILEINSKVRQNILLIAAFFPNSLVMSAIFLREIIPTYFVAVSLYFFILWFKKEKLVNILLSFLMLAFAAVFHSGVLGIFVGYAFFFLFYDKKYNKFLFNTQTILTFAILVVIALFAVSQFGNILLVKFKGVEDIEDIYLQANKRLGESAYLKGIQINSPALFLLFGPIKAFYFLTSPLPMNWRGGMDIFTFVFDSSLYFITIWYIWKNWKFIGERNVLIIALIITLVGVAFIFGIGVGNAGTAVRHRQKIIPLMLILLAVMMDEKQRYQERRYFNKAVNRIIHQTHI